MIATLIHYITETELIDRTDSRVLCTLSALVEDEKGDIKETSVTCNPCLDLLKQDRIKKELTATLLEELRAKDIDRIRIQIEGLYVKVFTHDERDMKQWRTELRKYCIAPVKVILNNTVAVYDDAREVSDRVIRCWRMYGELKTPPCRVCKQ